MHKNNLDSVKKHGIFAKPFFFPRHKFITRPNAINVNTT